MRFSNYILVSALMHLLVVFTFISLNSHMLGTPNSDEKVIEVELISSFGLKNEPATANMPDKIYVKPPVETESSCKYKAKDIKPVETVAPIYEASLTDRHESKKDCVDAESGNPLDSIQKSGEAGPGPAGAKIFAGPENDGKGRNFQQRYIDENFYYIKDLITQRLSYPPVARKMKWQGVVIVSFIVLEDGQVEDIRIVTSSGHTLLDRNVISTIQSVRSLPQPPVKAELTMPIKYVLSH